MQINFSLNPPSFPRRPGRRGVKIALLVRARRLGEMSHPVLFLVLASCIPMMATNVMAKQHPAAKPICRRVDNIIGLPKGNHDYLRFYRKIVGHAEVHRQQMQKPGTVAGPWAPSTRVQADIRRLVQAISDGAQPTALRSRIVGALTLDRRFMTPGHAPWRYGDLSTRMEVASMLATRSRALWRRGDRKAAAALGRAGLFLWSQDDIQMGPAGVLAYCCSGTPTANASLAAMGLRASAAKKLVALYRSAVARYRRLFTARLADEGNTLMAKGAERTGDAVLNRYLAATRRLLARSAGHLFYVYSTLGSLHSTMRGLSQGGHQHAVRRVSTLLADLRPRALVGQDGGPETVRAVLRWIKEAMGP